MKKILLSILFTLNTIIYIPCIKAMDDMELFNRFDAQSEAGAKEEEELIRQYTIIRNSSLGLTAIALIIAITKPTKTKSIVCGTFGFISFCGALYGQSKLNEICDD